MRRTIFVGFLALGAIGCSDLSSPDRLGAPTAPSGAVSVFPAEQAAHDALRLLFPSGVLEKSVAGVAGAADNQLTNVFKSMGGGQTKAAQQQAAALCSFLNKQQAAGRVLSGANVDQFCNTLYSTVALGSNPPSDADVVAEFVPVDAGDRVVKVPSSKAGVFVPQGAFGQDVTVIIRPAEGAAPLNAPADRQFPYFYHFETVPALAHFAANVTVQVCTDETKVHPAASLRLAHNVNNGLEVLEPRAGFITCPEPPIFIGFGTPGLDRNAPLAPQFLAAGSDAARYVGRKLLSAVTPNSLYASNIQLAGSSGSFSPFGAYYPGPVLGLSPTSTTGTDPVVFMPTNVPAGVTGVSCEWDDWRSSAVPSVGSFDDGEFYPSPSPAPTTTTISGICNGMIPSATPSTDGGTPVSYIVRQIVTVNPGTASP